MLTSDFDYDLPPELIAQQALERGRSRLLTVPSIGRPEDHQISELPEMLSPGDLLVVNNTRVLAARLFGRRPGGGRAEILLVAPRDPEAGIDRASEWICLGRPRKRMRPGTRILFHDDLRVEVLEHLAPDRLLLRFSSPPVRHLSELGHVPLPPYIARDDTDTDRDRYQTVYAEVPGAVAAPTAGLHFDRDLLGRIEARGIGVAKLTLHVGPGTFRPVSVDRIDDHTMESERFEIDDSAALAIERTRASGGQIVAVGTTVVRTLESAVRSPGGLVAAKGSTELFIKPGFEFKVVDRLLTNFHLPRSTLLMLVSAFAGRRRVLDAYRLAVERGYRFYSYGDAMLLDRYEGLGR
ncbi:MAG: tRNA preQ1(34) S-adenosylmethionine ribosyltransferase-isomerase QueA [bacterium]|nr:tRNA preQ1(34) S-adenosylmethionine ribosyltransferase-isomerase QueA [bacterium]